MTASHTYVFDGSEQGFVCALLAYVWKKGALEWKQ